MRKIGLTALGAAVGLAMSAGVAQASISFTVNPSAIGEAEGAFSADFVDFSYNALVDQTVSGAFDGSGDTFTEIGAGFFGTFRDSLANTIAGTGLGTSYKLYALFTGSGSVSPTGPGGIRADFSSFSLEIWADPGLDSSVSSIGGTGGVDNDGFGGINGGSSFASGGDAIVFSGTGDDLMVASSTGLLDGEANVFAPALANGDYDILLSMLPVDFMSDGDNSNDFFSFGLTVPIGLRADFNGVNSNLDGFSAASFIDGRIINGSGNMFFEVPEPASLGMMGLGLIGIGALARRRRQV